MRTIVLTLLVFIWTGIIGIHCIVLDLLALPFPFEPSYWLGRLWSRWGFLMCGIRLDVSGWREIDISTPIVLVSNHQGFFDIPAIFLAIPSRIRFIAKGSMRWIPVVGWYMWFAGYVFINRKNRQKAVESMEKAGRLLRGRNLTVVVFAEGTRSSDGKMQPFKKGAFHLALQTGLPILPVAIL